MQPSIVTNTRRTELRRRSSGWAALVLLVLILLFGNQCSGGSGDCAQGLCAIGQDFDEAALLLTSALYAQRIQMVSEAMGSWEVGAMRVETSPNSTARHQIVFSSCAENPAACALALALDMKGACMTERQNGLIERSRIVIPLEFFAELANEPYEIRRKVIIHEIGHCLGLEHAGGINEVMAPSLFGAITPSHQERGAVRNVYELHTPSPLIEDRIPGQPIFTLVLPSGQQTPF